MEPELEHHTCGIHTWDTGTCGVTGMEFAALTLEVEPEDELAVLLLRPHRYSAVQTMGHWYEPNLEFICTRYIPSTKIKHAANPTQARKRRVRAQVRTPCLEPGSYSTLQDISMPIST